MMKSKIFDEIFFLLTWYMTSHVWLRFNKFSISKQFLFFFMTWCDYFVRQWRIEEFSKNEKEELRFFKVTFTSLKITTFKNESCLFSINQSLENRHSNVTVRKNHWRIMKITIDFNTPIHAFDLLVFFNFLNYPTVIFLKFHEKLDLRFL